MDLFHYQSTEQGKMLTLNSIYEARFTSHWASSNRKATQYRWSNAFSSRPSSSRNRIPDFEDGTPAQIGHDKDQDVQRIPFLCKEDSWVEYYLTEDPTSGLAWMKCWYRQQQKGTPNLISALALCSEASERISAPACSNNEWLKIK